MQEEVLTVIDMIKRDVIPSVRSYEAPNKAKDLAFLEQAVKQLEEDMHEIIRREEEAEKVANTTDTGQEMIRTYSRSTEDNPGTRSKPVMEVCPDLDSAAVKARECRLERVSHEADSMPRGLTRRYPNAARGWYGRAGWARNRSLLAPAPACSSHLTVARALRCIRSAISA